MGAIQFGSIDVLVDTFHNYGGTDIPAGVGVLADTSNPPSGDNAGGIVIPTASGGVVGTLGVTVENIKAGKTGRVRLQGVSVCTANGSITYGTAVQISDTASHLGEVKTCGAGITQLGVALNEVSAGELVRVFHSVARNA